MPVNAFGVLATFVASAVLIGSVITRVIGPQRATAAILPVGASIVALGSVGHSLKLGFGPTINLFGYDVRLFFDLGLAAIVSLVVAVLQRAVLHRRAAAD